MEQNKHYYAFISHSSLDQKMAFWLRDQLEKYRIPTSIQDKIYPEFKGVKMFKPCFAFQTDLAGGDLNKSLKKELTDSRYLIIICSPESAQSAYVNKEARHFIETGRGDKIIPFIIKGDPKECYSSALIELSEGRFFDEATQQYKAIEKIELRGVNYQQIKKDLHSKMAPVVNVIATMLGVRFDALWDRFRRRRRIRNASIGVTVAFVLLASLFLWGHYRPKYEYYADFVECKGVPQGVCPIPKELLKERELTYKFQYDYLSLFDKGRHLTRVECINSFEFPLMFDFHHINVDGMLKGYYPVVLLNYNDDKQVKSVTLCDVHGNPKIEYLYSGINLKGERSFIADIVNHNNNYDKNDFISMEERVNKTNIKRILYKTDEEGYVQSVTYHANNGNLKESMTMNRDGVYGYVFVVDSLHRPLSIISINAEKQRMNDVNGVNKMSLEYDDMSNVVKIMHFDKNDNPVNCAWNYCKFINEYDQFGNLIKGTAYDEKDQMCISKQGYAIEQHVYRNGCQIESTCFNENGDKTNNMDKCWKITHDYDGRGNCIKIRYFDTNDELTNNADGWSIAEMNYDENNNCIDKRTYNKDHQPVIAKQKGEARIVVEYDKFGRQVKGTSYGVNGEKIINKFGYCIEKRLYGKVGNVSLWECFDVDGNRICCKEGYAIMRSDVLMDDTGNQIIVFTFFDNEDNAVMSNEFKAHKIECTHDANGNLIEQRFYDTKDNLFANKDGVAIMRYAYDSKSRKIRDEYYDANDVLTNCIAGIAIIETDYPNDSTMVSYYKDMNGRMCMTADGYTIGEAVKSGDTITKYCFDSLHHLCVNRDGYAISKEVQDKQNNPVLGLYFDNNGIPTKRFDSIAGFRYVYDNRGNFLEEIFLGTDGKPSNCLSGYAITRSKYDDRDNRIEVCVYDENDSPVVESLFHSHKLVMKYDSQDRLIEGCTYDDNDELYYDPKNGFACIRHLYDLYGNEVEMTYWDDYLDRTPNKFGVHKETHAYDNRNNLVLKKTYDEYDNLTAGPDGLTAISENKWDDRNMLVQTVYFDADSVLLGIDEFQYNQFGFPRKVKRRSAGSPNTIELISTPYVYIKTDDLSDIEQYLVLEWENWNISNEIDYYIDNLLKSRLIMKKRMVVMTAYGQIIEMVFDENVFVGPGLVLEQVYQDCCKQYMSWKKR